MHDIDFDEIDRAVNSVTGTNQPVDTPVPERSTPRDPVPTPLITERESTKQSTPAPSLATRRSSGRFMDVVHPSSDMRPSQLQSVHTAPSAFAAPTPPAAPALEPVESAQPNTAVETPAKTPETAMPEPVARVVQESAAFHWPDPIDLQEQSTPEPVEEKEETPVVLEEETLVTEPVVTEVEDDEDDDINDILSAPLESPFLSNAKVEKRPLGAFSGADADLPLLEDFPSPTHKEPETTELSETLDEPEASVSSEVVEVTETPEALIEEVVPEKTHETSLESTDEIPRELHADVLMLDTHAKDEEEGFMATHASSSAIEASPTPTVAPHAADVHVGPTSISQQYKEQPTTDTQQPGSIYDTNTYHQPLAHPAKKRSSLLYIVWIIAIILLGGGLGAGFYLVVLPMLG